MSSDLPLSVRVKQSTVGYEAEQPKLVQDCRPSETNVTKAPPAAGAAQADEPPWLLVVVVESQKTFWPQTTGQVLLKVLEGEGAGGQETHSVIWTSKSAEVRVQGRGHRKYEASASVEKWEMVTGANVTLENGERRVCYVDIRPLPWVAFQVVDPKSQPVTGVTLKVTLPGNRKEQAVTAADDVRLEDIKSAGTCVIDEMNHTELWEVVKITSTA